ncbi:unnamed protein product [Lactuca saligna]|uniref:Uncharacterized protein n=1 Tax=Lactuca saligna TaxID=75948 RepID=A0AA35YWU4_LACSI|nr:unnamed protein product [Lactuca saligna]
MASTAHQKLHYSTSHTRTLDLTSFRSYLPLALTDSSPFPETNVGYLNSNRLRIPAPPFSERCASRAIQRNRMRNLIIYCRCASRDSSSTAGESIDLHEAMEKAISRSEGSWSGSFLDSISTVQKALATEAHFGDAKINRASLKIGEKIASGSCGDLLVFDHEREDLLGRHDAPVHCIEYSYATGRLDKTLKCWDPRGGGAQERALVGTYGKPERVYSISLVGNRVVVATVGRHVNVYDLRNISQLEQRRESSLKYQTRCVQCYPNGTRYALSSVEGRVAMEFFELTETGQAKKYAFKCQSKSEAGRDIIYPINAIAFHPM